MATKEPTRKSKADEHWELLLGQDNKYPTKASLDLYRTSEEALKGACMFNLNAGFYVLENIFNIQLDEWQKAVLASMLVSQKTLTKNPDDRFRHKLSLSRGILKEPNMPRVAGARWSLWVGEEPSTYGEVVSWLKLKEGKRGKKSKFELELRKAIEQDYVEQLKYNQYSLLVPRRNGKSYILIAYILINLIMGRRVAYTSYSENSAKELHRELQGIIEGSIARDYFELPGARAKGLVFINFVYRGTRNSVSITTRSGGSRGLKSDCVIFDEANNLSESDVAAYAPMTANSANPQVLYVGTPTANTGIANVASNVFRSVSRQNERTPNGAHVEWSSPKVVNAKEAADERVLKRFNPSYGVRINKNALGTFFNPLIFSIEHLGYSFSSGESNSKYLHPDIYDATKISKDDLIRIRNNKPDYTLGIDIYEGRYVCIAVCAKNNISELRPSKVDRRYECYAFDLLFMADLKSDDFDSRFTKILENYYDQTRCDSIQVSMEATTIAKRALGTAGLTPPPGTAGYTFSQKHGKARYNTKTKKSEIHEHFVLSYNKHCVSLINAKGIEDNLSYITHDINKTGSSKYTRFDSTKGWLALYLNACAQAMSFYANS